MDWGVDAMPCRARREIPETGPGRDSLPRGGWLSVDGMDNRAEVREFLISRRAQVSPEQVGLPAGTNRRVHGLRRSEVAALAGLSVEYYTRMERGAISGASPQVLESIARALRLDDAERAHLFDLAHAASPVARPPRRRSSKGYVPHKSLQWALDAVTAGPAFVRNGRMDLLAVNSLARAFYKDCYEMPGQPANIARFTFLDERAYDFYPDWDAFAEVTVSILRTEAGRDPHNKELHDLIGELGTRSEAFRKRWGAHNVRHHGTGFKTFNHPIVGEMTLAFEGLEMAAEPGLTLTIYTAEPGSPSAERMQLLASWAASEYGTAAQPRSEWTRTDS
ncbi:transcriptional regulator [Arthrobacter sp. StoSoilB5]|nr:transcriptional regulator [Arthrobacter sp. StoSoilB5]